MNIRKSLYWILGFTTITVVSFLLIPPLMKKISNKLYKYSLENDEIDFENLSPEIVKKEDTKE